MSKIPWVEFYRPSSFDNIVLEDVNKILLENILKTSYFPHLLLYGPPGTGKTTTIINLINKYHQQKGITNKDLIIHLNASDERGVDIIRNQIYSFVNAKSFFREGMKFVILDEVDYMTKNAQQALKYLLQSSNKNVRFCLICNYISKIDECLQNYFLKIRFNQLPKDNIKLFLKNIMDAESISIKEELLDSIIEFFNSDLRSMINYIQSNEFDIKNNNDVNIITNETRASILLQLTNNTQTINLDELIHNICIKYKINKKDLIKDLLYYLIRNQKIEFTEKFLKFVENLIHSPNLNDELYTNYFLSRINQFEIV